jgi:hypothetical protein
MRHKFRLVDCLIGIFISKCNIIVLIVIFGIHIIVIRAIGCIVSGERTGEIKIKSVIQNKPVFWLFLGG